MVVLFATGALAALAVQHYLYAGVAVAVLMAVWVAGPILRTELPNAALRVQPPDKEVALLELAQQERRMRALLDSAPALFLTLNPGGSLHAVNKAARATFLADDLILEPPPGLHEAIARAAAGERVTVRLPISGRKATEHSHLLAAVRATGAGGSYILVVLTDMEAELHIAEAAALRELLHVLSHEIMNSLTPVMSLVESAHGLLAEGLASNIPLAADALTTALRRAYGIDRFIQGYRSLARVPEPVLRPSYVGDLLREAASLFRARWEGYGLLLRLSVPEPDVLAQLDPDLILQALINLLTNAAEAALAARSRPPVVELSGWAQGAAVAFKVVDTGYGIPDGHEDAIFQPFFTLKEGGSGIGLGLARQIALSHGGTLILEPGRLGKPTTFLMTT